MKKLITILAAGMLLAGSARANETGVLIDALVEKDLLSPADAERIRAGIAREEAQTAVGKLKLTDSITELKLYGDGRLRYQYDQADAQFNSPAAGGTAAAIGSNPNVNQRSRWRFRLRLYADVKMGKHFFGGVGLQTTQSADSAVQTFEDGFDNYGIFINKMFLGWKPTDWLTIVAGKQANPFYTTELVWDSDINPTGLTEVIDLGKAFFPESKFSLQLIAGQFIFDDNNEFSLDSDLSTDAYLFAEQIKATFKFNKDTSVTIAPGFMFFNAADLSGLRNTRAFSDVTGSPVGVATQTQTTVTEAEQIQVTYSAAGVPTKTITPTKTTVVEVTIPSTGSPRIITTQTDVKRGRVKTVPAGLPVDPSLAGKQFTSTQSLGERVIVATSPASPIASGETRSLYILTCPGDVSFKLGGLKSKFYWDFAYNFNGSERFNQILALGSGGLQHHYSAQDALAWSVGFQLGDNKKAGDWSANVFYREIGIASIDPNLNDSDFALGAVNIRGIKALVRYNLADWLSLAASYCHAWNLKDNLIGGFATGGPGIADLNDVDVFQFDVDWKF